MRLLLLGGTAWFGKAVAAEAAQRGHEVVCAARGSSGPAADGTTLVRVDRDDPGSLAGLAAEQWDAVVDVTRIPSHARYAVEALGDATAYWLYVSTGSVYADGLPPDAGPDAPTVEPAGVEVDERSMEHYGELKRACEVAVQDALPDRSMLMRPGLIVGPGDPSGRFAYWPQMAASQPELLVPGSPDDPVQLIDVRDLATWTVTLCERQVLGVLNGIGPSMTREHYVAEVLRGTDAWPALRWVAQDRLLALGVEPWMGPRSLPVWLPLPEYAGFLTRDVSESLAAGLVVRPLADTARDTLAWLRATPDARVAGLTPQEHADLLARLGAG
jgi:nucleoside-diphosphate-sugar epimerase